VTDQRGGEIDHAPRHPAGGEQVAGEDEERDRHDLEAVDAGEELEADHLRVDVGEDEQVGEDREPERDRDRHAGRHQGEQQREQQLGAHRLRQLDDVEPGREADERERERDDDD